MKHLLQRNIFNKTTTLLFSLLILSLNIASALPKIEHWQTAEQANVYFIQTTQIPMLDIKVALPAGEQYEGKQYGLANNTAELMLAGTTSRPQEILLADIENLGAKIQFSSGQTHTTASFRSLTKSEIFNDAFMIFQDILKNPNFPEDQLALNIKTQLLALEAIKEDASALASEKFMNILYPNSPLGINSEMTKVSLATLKQNDIKAFYQSHYHATGAIIVLVGDIDLAKAKELSAKLSQTLGTGERKVISDITTSTMSSEKLFQLPFSGPQAQIIIGQNMVTRNDPDYFPLVLGNHILGGSGMTSLLFSTVREKEGLSYGIYSSINNTNLPAPFTIGFATSKEKVEQALAITHKTIADFIKNGPSEAELNLAKNNIVGGFILGLTSNAQLANALLTIGRYQLPLDYFDKYPEIISKISAKEIQAAFAKHINPDNFITVIVSEEVAKNADMSVNKNTDKTSDEQQISLPKH